MHASPGGHPASQAPRAGAEAGVGQRRPRPLPLGRRSPVSSVRLRERAGRTAWGNAGTGATRCRASRASAPSRRWPPGSPAIGSPSRAHFPAALPSTSRLSHHPEDSPGLLMLRAGGPLQPPSLSRCRSGPTAEVVGDMHTHVTAVDMGRARAWESEPAREGGGDV